MDWFLCPYHCLKCSLRVFEIHELSRFGVCLRLANFGQNWNILTCKLHIIGSKWVHWHLWSRSPRQPKCRIKIKLCVWRHFAELVLSLKFRENEFICKRLKLLYEKNLSLLNQHRPVVNGRVSMVTAALRRSLWVAATLVWWQFGAKPCCCGECKAPICCYRLRGGITA